jgi:hypothetical protein
VGRGVLELERGSLEVVRRRSRSAECRHLVIEVLDLLLECGAVRERTNAGKRRLGCDLGGTVRTEGCRVQARLRLEGEHSLDVGG